MIRGAVGNLAGLPCDGARSRGVIAAVAVALLVVAVGCAWVLFAPPQLGGQASYVIVNGNSMEPGMHRGDLAIVRPADRYVPGDVVTYRHPDVGHVIHRIIEEKDGRFILKGDHNDFEDSYRPTANDIVGKLWLHIPGAGSLLWHLRSPLWAGLVLFIAFAGVFAGAGASRAAAPVRPGRQRTNGGAPMTPIYRNWQDTLALLLALAIGFAALAWVAFARPGHREVTAEFSYSQRGQFSYEAAAVDARLYDAGKATTGEPVYLRLSDTVAFTFTYEFISPSPAQLTGTYQLVAELGDISGWKRTIPIGEPGSFAGTAFRTDGILRLADLQEQIATLEVQTGVRNDRYTVTIRPKVQVEGDLSGTPFTADFPEAALPMALDRTQLRLDTAKPDAAIAPAATGTVVNRQRVGNAVRILFVSVPVVAARLVGVAGAAVMVACAGALFIAVARRGWSEASDAHALDAVPVRVTGPVAPSDVPVVDVASMEDLERLAARTGGIILREARPGQHVCYVRDGGVVYRFAFDPGEYGTERAA
ncbi:signal peptidase [Tepidiforma thermophila]|uniref:Signal peptidase I n=1 Tax=Tepidiforma thermophila (strain KCTC 52669 / CGMCC 1.13589 / G233) TaxID=2761530 RepID=A0A2A9HGS5_TEPT2|nr:signal peptidase [Tepidiforma thermophila]